MESAEKKPNNDFVVLKMDDCEIVFEKGKGESYTPRDAEKKSAFMFEFTGAHRLTDRLVHVQHEDTSSLKKYTDIYIERSDMLAPIGAGVATRIPVLRIISS